MTQKLICMIKKELSRYEIIKDLIAGKINGTDASKQIGVTIRHIKRLKLKVDNNGIDGLIHKSRGKTGNRKLDVEIVKKYSRIQKSN